MFTMANTLREKELKNCWDELTASDSSKRVGHKQQLEPTGHLGVKSVVRCIERVGF